MSFSLTEDFKTLSEIEKKPREILEQVHLTGRPVVVTLDGKPGVVIMDATTYERKLKALNLGILLGEALADVKAGRTRPIDDFMKEFLRDKKIPSRDRRNGAKRRRQNP